MLSKNPKGLDGSINTIQPMGASLLGDSQSQHPRWVAPTAGGDRPSIRERSEPKPRVLEGRNMTARGKRGTSAAPGTPPPIFIPLSPSDGERARVRGIMRLASSLVTRKGEPSRNRCGSLHRSLAESCKQPRQAHRPATPRPGKPTLPHDSPARQRRAEQHDFPTNAFGVISSLILDRNSHLCFHNRMETAPLKKINRARSRARSES